MTIAEIIEARGITEVLHFTTNKGALGILDSQLLKARARLNTDARLEYIFTPNAASRSRDMAWLNYVNLSISRINNFFFARSAGNWHKYTDLWWCVLSFSPEVLTHEGVVFTTTNNIYTGVKRQPGPDGMEAMFAPKVHWYLNRSVTRPNDFPDCYTTCEQAEVLYPDEVSTQYLRKIYVPNDEIADELAGQLHTVRHPPLDIAINNLMFQKLL